MSALSSRPRLVLACLIGLVCGLAVPAHASAPAPRDRSALTYATDKMVYVQGEVVQITATNRSEEPVQVVDRVQVDGSFVVIERLSADGSWTAIELYAVANVTTFRRLQPGERHRYRWPTIGFSRANSVAAPGRYRIRFNSGGTTNAFEIRAGSESPRASARGN